MKVTSVRDLNSLKEVLEDPDSEGPKEVYWVFSDIKKDNWYNLTVIIPGDFGGEFPKTYGHYHPVDAPNETYHLVEGEGVLLMQRKKVEGGSWIEDEVGEVYLIKMNPGDEVVITPEWGHSWSNTGDGPILSYDDWRVGHTPKDYEVIERLEGMAYYLRKDGNEISLDKNPNYKDLPEPKWVSASEFRMLNS